MPRNALINKPSSLDVVMTNHIRDFVGYKYKTNCSVSVKEKILERTAAAVSNEFLGEYSRLNVLPSHVLNERYVLKITRKLLE
jgi:hypothetical protein